MFVALKTKDFDFAPIDSNKPKRNDEAQLFIDIERDPFESLSSFYRNRAESLRKSKIVKTLEKEHRKEIRRANKQRNQIIEDAKRIPVTQFLSAAPMKFVRAKDAFAFGRRVNIFSSHKILYRAKQRNRT